MKMRVQLAAGLALQSSRMAYLYWLPTNAAELAPCAIHEAEIEEFAGQVADPKVRFISMAYPTLWSEWSSSDKPKWLRDHAKALQNRYETEA